MIKKIRRMSLSPNPKNQFKLDWNLIEKSHSKCVKELGEHLHQCILLFYGTISELITLKTELNEIKTGPSLSSKHNSCGFCSQFEEERRNKDSTIQSLMSALLEVKETQRFEPIDNVLKIVTSDKSNEELIDDKDMSKGVIDCTIKQEESLCEIAGTPTGRTSPVFDSKRGKNRNVSHIKTKSSASFFGCNNIMPPEKVLKLSTRSFSKIKGTSTCSKKMVQSKLCIKEQKSSKMVDVSLYAGQDQSTRISVEDDDIILPSPTSSVKKEINNISKPEPTHLQQFIDHKQNSVNLDNEISVVDDDLTFIQSPPGVGNSVRSNILAVQSKVTGEDDIITQCSAVQMKSYVKPSPKKRKSPLSLIRNYGNKDDSVSLLKQKQSERIMMEVENIAPQNINNYKQNGSPVKDVDFIYKEEPIRKRADKMALPGWSCEECEQYYGVLYNGDQEMLRKKMNECSKHRSKFNPNRRFNTPPGFWKIGFTAPDDPDELNRLNNVE